MIYILVRDAENFGKNLVITSLEVSVFTIINVKLAFTQVVYNYLTKTKKIMLKMGLDVIYFRWD